MDYPAALDRLRSELPSSAANLEEASRVVLGRLVERALEEPVFSTAVPVDPRTCPNCGIPANSGRSPYCGDRCRDTASFVRAFRAAVVSGSILETERQVVLGQVLWNVERGGFPLRQALVPKRALAQVLERCGGKCAECGAPATEIDHTGSG